MHQKRVKTYENSSKPLKLSGQRNFTPRKKKTLCAPGDRTAQEKIRKRQETLNRRAEDAKIDCFLHERLIVWDPLQNHVCVCVSVCLWFRSFVHPVCGHIFDRALFGRPCPVCPF